MAMPSSVDRVPSSAQPLVLVADDHEDTRIMLRELLTMDGFIVMETSASTDDALNFSGNLTQSPVPNHPEFNPVRAITGVSVLAPGASMAMSGSSGGAVRGNIIVKSFSFAGAANLQIDLGSIMTLSDGPNSAVFNGAKSILFSATGGNNLPSEGVTYTKYYLAKANTYTELTP